MKKIQTLVVVHWDGKVLLGMTVDSLAPKALKVAGIDFGDLLASWVDAL